MSTGTLLSVKDNSLVIVHGRQLNVSYHHTSCKYRMGHYLMKYTIFSNLDTHSEINSSIMHFKFQILVETTGDTIKMCIRLINIMISIQHIWFVLSMPVHIWS